jgi:hypothetical protein
LHFRRFFWPPAAGHAARNSCFCVPLMEHRRAPVSSGCTVSTLEKQVTGHRSNCNTFVLLRDKL